MNPDLVEQLASLEHEQWRSWAATVIRYMPSEIASRWVECFVPYTDLPEIEKSKDRKFAEKSAKIFFAKTEALTDEIARANVRIIQLKEEVAKLRSYIDHREACEKDMRKFTDKVSN